MCDVKKYEKWYGIEHKSPQFIEEAVYGLCEINREDIVLGGVNGAGKSN